MSDAPTWVRCCTECGREFVAKRPTRKLCGTATCRSSHARKAAENQWVRDGEERARVTEERQQRLLEIAGGPRKRYSRRPNLFDLVPDVPVDDVEIGNPELHSLAQAVIYARAALIRETWSPSKQRKRNNYYAEPLEINPIPDLHFDDRRRDATDSYE